MEITTLYYLKNDFDDKILHPPNDHAFGNNC